MIDPDTLEETILMPCSPFAHFICDKQNKYMVGDSQGSDVPIHLLNQEEQEKARAEGIIRMILFISSMWLPEQRRSCATTARHGWPSTELRRTPIPIPALPRTIAM